MTTDIVSLVLTENEGVYTVSGVNAGETDGAVAITLNGETICSFTVEAPTQDNMKDVNRYLKSLNSTKKSSKK